MEVRLLMKHRYKANLLTGVCFWTVNNVMTDFTSNPILNEFSIYSEKCIMPTIAKYSNKDTALERIRRSYR